MTSKRHTRIVQSGRRSHDWWGLVNPPICHGSTILFPDVAELEEATAHPFGRTFYGRMGTPTNFCFEEAVADLYRDEKNDATFAVATSSGLAAATIALTAYLKQGDEVLMADPVYGATRRFADVFLTSYGVTVTYFDPAQPLDDLINERVKVIFMESPGSLTFEVQDVPGVVSLARRHDIITVLDNTWATGLYFNPLALGVDIAVESATKYIVGHADAMLGVMVCGDESMARHLRRAAMLRGDAVSAERCYLGQRGIRTLPLRLRHHQTNAMTLATWLEKQPQVKRVCHPGLSSFKPFHELWKRDFRGASGLFALELMPCERSSVHKMLNGLHHFGIGYSWGGYESLILPVEPAKERTVTDWKDTGIMVRIHAGLEDVQDLMDDLRQGMALLKSC